MANNVRKFKSNKINLGMIIFAVIFIYIIVCVIVYLTSKHIVGYEVKEGSLSTNNIYTGIAIRSEEIVNASQAGYVNYYTREGERVGVGNLVYTIDESGKLNEYLNSESEDNTLSEADLSELKTEILSYVSTFNKTNYSTVYDFKYGVQGTVLKLANANALENIDSINQSGISDMVLYNNAANTGVVVYSIDGFENTTTSEITSDSFNTDNYEKKQLISSELVASGDPVYKLETSEDWDIVIQTDADKAAELLDADYVLVKFLKNQNTSWAKISTRTDENDNTFVCLSFTNSMISFCTDRFIDIELITETETGLKIPNSSIVEKEFFIVPKDYITKGGNSNEYGVLREAYTEDGTATTEFVATTIYNETEDEYYLDDSQLRIGDYIIMPDSTEKYALSKRGSLIGVYNINKGYADFKQVNILYQNKEYSIVLSNTNYGLNVYDYIVLDASTVQDDELIYE